jgi:hypothetical protein
VTLPGERDLEVGTHLSVVIDDQYGGAVLHAGLRIGLCARAFHLQ